jgi:hypothetical protein
MSAPKRIPALAKSLGAVDDEAEVDDAGADDEESAQQAAGDAAIEALKANDGLALMKAIAAGLKASE